ncbi:hypothetical protein Q7P35_003382 [Cladosporium inversicolor]
MELHPTEGQRKTVETEYCALDRSGHRYDRVQIGGESRNHLGDVYTKNVTYNYGAPFLSSESTGKQREDQHARFREEARLEIEKRSANENQRLEFLQALEFDATDSRQATIGQAHTDTCTWIVEAPEYLRWRDESYLPTHHGVLWIKGNPDSGSGKSTLMKYTLRMTQEQACGDLIACFFFNARGEFLEGSAEGLYRSLPYQVLSELPYLYSDRTHIKQQKWSVEMMENMLQTSVLALKPDEHLVLYIDALDECIQDEVRDVVGHFENLVDLATSRGLRFSICLSSRHYPHITMQRFEELRLDDRNEHIEDISKFVHSNVDRLSIPISAKTKIETEIISRSFGVFLWAVLVIKILRGKRDDGASLSGLTIALATVPDKLGILFASILEDSDKNTITAVQWILYARLSLSPEELYFAIKTTSGQLSTGEWDRDDVDEGTIRRFVVCSTRGLAEAVKDPLRKTRWTMYFIHESVREHLLRGGLASLTTDVPQPIEGFVHAQIAQCCLSYLQLDSSKYLRVFEGQQCVSWFSSERFRFHFIATKSLFYHADLAYEAGVLSLKFLSELHLKLLICSYNMPMYSEHPGRFAIAESATILFLLLINGGHALAKALLEDCSKTETPGVIISVP